MSDDWITYADALARVIEALKMPEGPASVEVGEEIDAGRIRMRYSSWHDVDITAGGITNVDAEYDERLGEVLRAEWVSLDDLVWWLREKAKIQTGGGSHPHNARATERKKLAEKIDTDFAGRELPKIEEARAKYPGVSRSTVQRALKDLRPKKLSS